MPQHRALEWLHEYGRRYPRAWEMYANIHDNRRMKRLQPHNPVLKPQHDWPDWCWAPLAASHSIISHHVGVDINETTGMYVDESDMAPRPDVGGLGAVAAWRATQGIYRIDPTLYAALYDTPLDGKVPTEVFQRLPAWCVYVECPEGSLFQGQRSHGFFAHLEYDLNTLQPFLRFAVDMERDPQLHANHTLMPMALALRETMEESLAETERFRRENFAKRKDEINLAQRIYEEAYAADIADKLPHYASIVLYLCADDRDMPVPDPLPKQVVQTKKGRNILPMPRRPQVIEAGVRLGAALRWAREKHDSLGDTSSGRTVEGHIRRAHFHTFWTGPRDGVRVPKVKWLPPIRVNLDDVPEHAVLHPVE
jgi:hypothetical protein